MRGDVSSRGSFRRGILLVKGREDLASQVLIFGLVRLEEGNSGRLEKGSGRFRLVTPVGCRFCVLRRDLRLATLRGIQGHCCGDQARSEANVLDVA